MIDSANLSWGTYPLLSHGATEALKQHGEEWQREVFLKPIVEGRWTGTMCLTEPHCGSDLGLLKTKAEPNADGTYRDHRHEDLHHRRRARSDRKHRASRARAPARCAGRHAKAFRCSSCRSIKTGKSGKMGERNSLACGIDRAQDGHQGLGDVRDEFRRRRRLADRPAEPRPDGDVHHDEYRAACRRAARARADRTRVSEQRSPTRAIVCRCARCRARNSPTNRPIR